MGEVLVFDVGGSHIAGSTFNAGSMTICAPHNHFVEGNSSSVEFFKAFESLANRIAAPASLNGAAIAIPNPFDHERGISFMQHKYQELYGIDLRQELSKRLGCSPDRICFLNDAAAFLTGELYQGSASGVHRVIGITLGTGVGSAFAVNGKIVDEGEGIPSGGEIWNLPYGNSIVENFISAQAVGRIHEQLGGKNMGVREIASMAAEDIRARQTFEQFGRNLGKILRDFCSGFHPQQIVLGGGVSNAAGLFLSAAEEELAEAGIPLSVSTLLDQAALIGAGIHWKQKYITQNGAPKLHLAKEV